MSPEPSPEPCQCQVSGISAPETCFVGDEDDITITGTCLDGLSINIPGSTTVSSTEEKNAAGHIVKITRRVKWTTPGEHTLSATCGQSSAEKKINVYKVDIEWNDQIVTDGTVPRIVGQPIALKAIIEPAPPAETTYRWSVPDKCIKYYDMPDTLMKIDPSLPLLGNCNTYARELLFGEGEEDFIAPEISFYSKGVPNQPVAKLTVTISNREKSASTTLNIARPAASLTAQFSVLDPVIDAPLGSLIITCGRRLPTDPDNQSAIRLLGEVTPPAGGDGKIAFIQRIRSHRHAYYLKKVNGDLIPEPDAFITPRFVLDRSPKDDAPQIPQFGSEIVALNSNQTRTVSMLDSLEVRFKPKDTNLDIRDDFEVFLMYQPTGGIWVTLRKCQWFWDVNARRSNSGEAWNYTSRQWPTSQNTLISDSTQLPTWDSRVQDRYAEYVGRQNQE